MRKHDTANAQTTAPAGNEARVLAPDFASSWRRDRVFFALLFAAALLGIVYNFVIMPGFGPDEARHLNYTRLLLEERRFPFLQSDGKEYGGAHTYHPPLYYVCQAPFYLLGGLLPGDGRWHLMRLGSLLLCLLALPLTYDIAMRALNGSRNGARLATAHFALLPIFGMTSGIINNDSATLLACVLFLWLLLRHPLCGIEGSAGAGPDLRAAFLLGLVFGLGALCKGSVLPAGAAALFTAFWLGRKNGALSSLARWKNLAVVLLVAGVIAAPWYLRNRALYGSFQPIPPDLTNPALPDPSAGALVMMMHDNFPPLFALANTGMFNTQWSQIDWIPPALRAPVFWALFAYFVLATLGIAIAARRRKNAPVAASSDETKSEYSRAENAAHAAGIVALAPYPMMWLSCLYIALFVHWGQAEGGRYLLPTFAGFGVWLAAGWRGLVGENRLKIVFALWCAAMLLLNAVAIYWLLAFLNPTHGPQR